MDGKELMQAAADSLPSMISENRLRCWFLTMFHGQQFKCCHCGGQLSRIAGRMWLLNRVTTCRNCGKKVFFFKKTLFQGARITPQKFILMLVLFSANTSINDIARTVGLSRSTVSDWAKKLEVVK